MAGFGVNGYALAVAGLAGMLDTKSAVGPREICAGSYCFDSDCASNFARNCVFCGIQAVNTFNLHDTKSGSDKHPRFRLRTAICEKLIGHVSNGFP